MYIPVTNKLVEEVNGYKEEYNFVKSEQELLELINDKVVSQNLLEFYQNCCLIYGLEIKYDKNNLEKCTWEKIPTFLWNM